MTIYVIVGNDYGDYYLHAAYDNKEAADAALAEAIAIQDAACKKNRYRTYYDLRVWPVELSTTRP